MTIGEFFRKIEAKKRQRKRLKIALIALILLMIGVLIFK